MEIYEHNKLHGNAPQPSRSSANKRGRVWVLCAFLALLCVVAATVIGCRAGAAKSPDGEETEPYRALYAQVGESVVQVWCGSKTGSGVIYTIRGGKTYIITNHHVIEDGVTPTVQLGDRGVLTDAVVCGYDAYHDIALIAVDGVLGNAATVGGVPQVGQRVLAVGNNLGYGVAAFDGIVSRTNRMLYVKDDGKNVPVYAVTAPINAGMSGGGLFTFDGKLVGINTYQTTTADNGDRIVDGTSYSVPVTIAEKIARRILENENGAQVEKIEVAGSTDSGTRNTTVWFTGLYFRAAFDSLGLQIDWVDPVAPDVRGGMLQAGDTVVRIGGLSVTSQTEFHEIFAECLKYRDTTGAETQSGDALTLVLQRGDKTVEIYYECKRLQYA